MYVQGKREAEKGEKETTTQMEQNKTQQQKTKQSTALMFHDGLILARREALYRTEGAAFAASSTLARALPGGSPGQPASGWPLRWRCRSARCW